ncbi:MAG TPA: outer membrane beta-barrel protein [Bryobacteraceae bacterium]|jgi:hypothetical protein|nr:outer membrane beta-barrel protein [Bryobacteraceae bacterium]
MFGTLFYKNRDLVAGFGRLITNCGILAGVTLCITCLHAQEVPSHRVTLGFIGGVPISDWFNINGSNLSAQPQSATYSSADIRYTFGPSAEFHFGHIVFEVDGLYKRINFATSAPFSSGGFYNENVKANWWEVPGLFKFNMHLGHVRPFVEAGAVLRHISTLDNVETSPANYAAVMDNNAPELHNRNSYGGVAGIGVTFKWRRVSFSPEVRYTRWSNEAFEYGNLLRTNLDQGDVLVGVHF